MGNNSPAQFRDAIFPTAVVGVVGMMVVPMPTALLDALLICNISFALALLVSSVYLSEPQKFTTLPTILLLATLFRLGLNISTTRQLLSGGTAPEVILTFGNFVVGGNIVVGVVIFSIITLVQFLVIAKGAERVAEVAARFTLDAMPGRQMSIDADLRAGIIGLSEARERRQELQVESKLFGALDGAMKFVKGDAIAGLFITIINITAGLIVGVTQQGLSLGAAIQKYSLYTIGDGLVSQIPALLVAIAAGIAVTRVGDSEMQFVGREMFAQLSREPQALSTTAGVLFMLALVPGLPTLALLAAVAFFFIASRKVLASQVSARRQSSEGEFRPKVFSGIVLKMSVEATRKLQEEGMLAQNIQSIRSEMFERWGVIVPDIQFDVDTDLVGQCVTLLFNSFEFNRIVGETEKSNGLGSDVSSEISDENRLGDRVALLLKEFLKLHCEDLLDDTHTRILLETHRATSEDLINSVVPELISITALTTLLRQLVREKVSIRNASGILQAVAEYRLEAERESRAGEGKIFSESGDLLARVRTALKREICQGLLSSSGQLHVWKLDGDLDHKIAKATLCGALLEPETVEQIIQKIGHELASCQDHKLTVVTSKLSRTTLANLLLEDCPEVRIIAADELPSKISVILEGEIGVASRESENEQENENGQENEQMEFANVTPIRKAA